MVGGLDNSFIAMLKNQKRGGNHPPNKVGRSRSRSLSPQRSKPKLAPKQNQRRPPKTSRERNQKKDRLNPSLGRSLSKRSLSRSQSAKNVKNNKQNKRSSLQPRVGSSPSNRNVGKKPQGQGGKQALGSSKQAVGNPRQGRERNKSEVRVGQKPKSSEGRQGKVVEAGYNVVPRS